MSSQLHSWFSAHWKENMNIMQMVYIKSDKEENELAERE